MPEPMVQEPAFIIDDDEEEIPKEENAKEEILKQEEVDFKVADELTNVQIQENDKI